MEHDCVRVHYHICVHYHVHYHVYEHDHASTPGFPQTTPPPNHLTAPSGSGKNDAAPSPAAQPRSPAAAGDGSPGPSNTQDDPRRGGPHAWGQQRYSMHANSQKFVANIAQGFAQLKTNPQLNQMNQNAKRFTENLKKAADARLRKNSSGAPGSPASPGLHEKDV